MSEGYEHKFDNLVNIHIKLCVHPNIILKGTIAWIKRSLKVVTWLGSKRRDICGKIEFKWPSIREHSSIQIQNQIYKSPLSSKHNFGVTKYTLWSHNLFYFFFIFLSFLLFLLFFSFSCTHFSFLFLLYLHNNVVLIKKFKLHQFTWHLIWPPFSLQLKSKHNPIECSPILWQGTITWRFRVQQLKTYQSPKVCQQWTEFWKLRAISLSNVFVNWQFVIEDSDSFGSNGLANTRSSHKVGHLWSSRYHSLTKMSLDHYMPSHNSK